MKNYLLCLLISALVFSTIINGQNLLLNPGFEQVNEENCFSSPYVTEFPPEHATFWDSPWCTPSVIRTPCGLFTPSDVSLYSSDSSLHFTSLGGSNMARILTLDSRPEFDQDQWGEYIRGTLSDTLTKDSLYRVTIHLMPDGNYRETEGYSYTDQFGLHFSSNRVFFMDEIFCNSTLPGFSRDSFKNVVNTLSTPPGLILDEPGVWRTFCWNYQAQGDETLLMLGSFVPWVDRNILVTNPESQTINRLISYFLDDISIVPISINQADPLADTVRYVCPGDSVVLSTRSGFGSVDWLTTGQSNTTSISVNAPGWYVVRAPLTDSDACCQSCGEVVDSIRIAYDPIGEELLALDSLRSCPDGFPFPVTAAHSVSWPDNSTGRAFMVPGPGLYPVSRWTACGALTQDTLVILLDDQPPAPALPDTLAVCPEDLGAVGLAASPAYDFYLWNGTPGNVVFTPTESGPLYFSGGDSCFVFRDTTWVQIVSEADPDRWPPRQVLCPGDSLVLSVPPGFNDFAWGDGFSGRQRSITNGGTYRLTLFHACGSFMRTTEVARLDVCGPEAEQAYLPTAFSPNLDGINDHFECYPGPAVTAISHFRLFDRWGGLLIDAPAIDSIPPFQLWDGNVQQQPATSGSYTYTIELHLLDGTRRSRTGTVTLLR